MIILLLRYFHKKMVWTRSNTLLAKKTIGKWRRAVHKRKLHRALSDITYLRRVHPQWKPSHVKKSYAFGRAKYRPRKRSFRRYGTVAKKYPWKDHHRKGKYW